MKVKKREPEIEAIQFTGDNFEELKALVPHLEKYDFRKSLNKEQALEGFEFKGYTVGWKTEQPPFGEAMTEALPGFYVVKEDDEFNILDPHEFKKLYD